MHIALCTDGVFPLAMGGMQRHSRLLAEELARFPGLRLTVIHPHGERIFDPELNINEVFVEPIDPQRFYFRQLWKYSVRVAGVLKELAPDVIISQGFSVWAEIERFRSRLIVHPHGLEMFQTMGLKERAIGLPFKWALKGIMRRAAVVISLGGRLTPLIEAEIRGSNSRVVVIPNAVDVPERPAEYPQHEKLKILFVGRFAFNKGIDVLMKVAKRFDEDHNDRVRFVLAGDGPLLEHYRSKGIPANMELLGRVDDDRLFSLYEACDALVLPTRFEGMPTVVMEAMARARPVFVSDVGATAALVDTANGYLLPKGDPDALFNAIKEFMALNPEERARLGAAGHAKARSLYQWPVVAAAYLHLAKQLQADRSITA